jgi:hypothetical protein
VAQDVIIRVRAVRPYGMKAMLDLLVDSEMQAQCSRDPTAAQVLPAARSPTPYTLRPAPHPTPYTFTLHPSPYTLHYLHPTPYTLHPTEYTLNPQP